MAQKEKTVQPSPDEANQSEGYQKTRNIAAAQIKSGVEANADANPSLQNLPGATAPTPQAPEPSPDTALNEPEQETLHEPEQETLKEPELEPEPEEPAKGKKAKGK